MSQLFNGSLDGAAAGPRIPARAQVQLNLGGAKAAVGVRADERSGHTFLADVRPAQWIEGVYCIHNTQLGQTKTGKPYLKALLRDRSGQVAARMWSVSEDLVRSLPGDGFVWIEGRAEAYQGEKQLILESIRKVEVPEDALADLLPCTTKNVDEMFRDLSELLATLEHPCMRALAAAYLDDEPLMDCFRRAPAAVSLHHAYLGGLLEHTLQLCRLADLMLTRYPRLNRDLVLVGLFLHDMAKCEELVYDQAFAYSASGNLIGHLVLGSLLLERKAHEAAERLGAPFPQAPLTVLHHIILSHHGVPEYGAAKLPSTPEAIFVCRLDELDAKTQMALDAARPEGQTPSCGCNGAGVGEEAEANSNGNGNGNGDGESEGHFTDKLWALGTRLYKPDPLRGT